MALGRVPVGRIAILIALAVGIWAVTRRPADPRWKPLAPGVEFGTMRGEPYTRRGSSEIALLRLDPAQVKLSVHHYSIEPKGAPLALSEWQRRLGAMAVFNAGQYYPDHSYMGMLISGGRVVSGRGHPQFRAALVAGPVAGGRAARVLDLDRTPLGRERHKWREVAQSFMLFDAREPRVRRSELVANRTAVGEDRRGRLIVVTTEGGYTLWEFAQLLRRSPLGLDHAMSMDGGHESGLCVEAPNFRYQSNAGAQGGETVPLPAVIAVSRP